jgi:hypothetical protein
MGMTTAAFHYDTDVKNVELFHSLGLGDFTKTGVGEGPSQSPYGLPELPPEFQEIKQATENQSLTANGEICNMVGRKGPGRAQVHVGGFDRCR